MSAQVAKNRFIYSSLHGWAALYQQLFSNLPDIHKLGTLLIQEAETVQTLRQAERLQELGLMLSVLPVKEYQAIGQYYAGWGAHFQGQDTRHIFEQVLEDSTTYKAKALIGLAAVEAKKGDYESELKYFVEAAKSPSTLSVRLDALRGVAIVKAKESYHKQSLSDLEGLLPFTRYMDSKAYLAYLNSFAVELGEVGRVEEARNVINIVLASPYAFAYPEWRETSNDIELRGYKSRSVLSFNQRIVKPDDSLKPIAPDVSFLPKPDRSRVHAAYWTDIYSFQERKKKMVKEPNGDIENMGDKDLFMEIMHLASQETITTTKLKKILAAVQKITSEPDN